MAKTLSVDLVLNSMGFKQGIEQAKEGTEQYASAVKISDANIKALNRAMTNSQKEARALAIAFNSLSKAEQESAKGQALQRQMWETAEAAAKLKDITGDTAAMIKAMSSDTAGLDALKEGMEIGKSAATAYAGAIAKLSGNDQALKDVVANLAMIEGAFGTAIKINTALQKQSSIMIGIRRIQLLASKKAVEAETAATKGATVAQKAFNLVAKANPYVLLATAAVAAAAAIGGYMLATRKSAEEEERQQLALKASEDALDAYKTTMTSTLSSSLTKYKTLQAQWNALKTDHERTQFAKDKAKEFKEFGEEVKSVNDVERILDGNSKPVVDGLIARAKAAAYAAQAQQYYSKMVEASIKIEELQAKRKKELSEVTKPATRTVAGSGGNFGYVQTYTVSVEEQQAEINKKYEKDLAEWNKTQDEFEKKGDALINKSADILKDLPTISVTDSSSSDKDKKRIDYTINSLKYLEAELNVIQERRAKGLLPNMNAQEYLDKVKELKEQISEKKIELGIELPKSDLDKLNNELKDVEAQLPFAISEEDVKAIQARIKKLKEDIENEKIRLQIVDEVDAYEKKLTDSLKEAERDYKLAVKNDDEAAKQAALEAYRIAQKKLNDYKLSVKIVPILDDEKFNEAFSKIEEKLTKNDKTWNFDGLGDDVKKQAEDIVKRIEGLKDAQKEYIELQKQTSDPDQIKQIQERIDAYKEEEQALSAYADKLEELSDGLKAKEKKFKQFSDTVGAIGDAVGVINSMQSAITSLGDAFEEGASGWEKFTAVMQMGMTVLQAIITVMGIINTIQEIFNTGKAVAGQETTKEAAAHTANATAIIAETAATTANAAADTAAVAPTMLLTQAMMKLAAANIFNAHSFIPFAGPAIASGFVGAMEALVNSIVAFKDGGIVPGNSFSGDKVLARLNSNEMVLNTQQQKRLFAMLNGLEPLRGSTQSVEIQGVIRGKDLMLVQKNYNSLAGKSKQNINIG